MTSLVDWLLECLAERESAAREAIEQWAGTPAEWHEYSLGGKLGDAGWDAFGLDGWWRVNDPWFVLADVEAKRAIVALHWNLGGSCGACGDAENFGARSEDWPCPTLRLLAQPYRGLDGWRAEWDTKDEPPH